MNEHVFTRSRPIFRASGNLRAAVWSMPIITSLSTGFWAARLTKPTFRELWRRAVSSVEALRLVLNWHESIYCSIEMSSVFAVGRAYLAANAAKKRE